MFAARIELRSASKILFIRPDAEFLRFAKSALIIRHNRDAMCFEKLASVLQRHGCNR